MKNARCAALLFLGLFIFFFASPAPGAEDGAKVNVRLLTLKGIYVDHPSSDEFSPLTLMFAGMERPKSFPELCRQLEGWSQDIEVDHVVVDFSKGTALFNLAQALELSRQLRSLQGAGKRTFALLGNASAVPFLVASGCEKILITDLSMLDFASLSLTVLHFHDLMKILGVEASVVRAGDFKGAVEPFTRSEMSPELRAHYQDMLVSMNDSLVDQIAQARKLTPAQVRDAQAARIYTAKGAKEKGLVDEIIAPGEERSAVQRLLDQSVNWVEPTARKPAKSLSFFDLVGKLLAPPTRPTTRKPSLAVLHLDGAIMDTDETFSGVLTPQTISEAVDQLEKDDAIKGVVVRVNSPGGSASASEAIRRALERLAKSKPLVFSFGEVAASGGYWVSCISRPIFAESSTITGSIGVFALKLSGKELLHKVGIKLDTVSLDESATAFSLARGWSAQEQTQVQALVDETYARFVDLVATSRPLSKDAVEPIAGGRVWSGSQAAERKLVDHLGGLQDALDNLAKQTGLDEGYPVLHWPQEKSFLEKFDLFGAAGGELEPAWAQLLPAQLKRQIPWQLIQAGLAAKTLQTWLLLPAQFQIQ